ncbi:MAG TPA: hypothetical protein VEH78_06750 [Pseudolabrys sp.]|nr:hypothetical protein [Pseudolabrys sp.]
MISRRVKLVSAVVGVALVAMLAPRFVGVPSVQSIRYGILTCGETFPAPECEKLSSMLAR